MWAAAWAVATVAMVLPYPWLLLFAWAFPFGLFVFILPTDSDQIGGWLLLFVGWLLYIALTIYGLRQDRRTRFFVTYTVLCVLLILNVGGCHYNLNKTPGVSVHPVP